MNNKHFYNLYNDINTILSDNVYFMNHGFLPLYDNIKSYNCMQKNQANLYAHLLDGIDSRGMSILDISCGRGGGVRAIKDLYDFDKVMGCDYNDSLINFCIKKHPGIDFDVADAINLPYSDSSVDVIINVEASHAYSDVTKFYKEVARVLKPGGIFLYADVNEMVDAIKNVSSLFDVEKSEDITNFVYESCKQDISNLSLYEMSDQSREFLLKIVKFKARSYGSKAETFKLVKAYKRSV